MSQRDDVRAFTVRSLGEIATIERNAIAPEAIPNGALYVGLEHMTSDGEFLGVAPVQNGSLASTKFRFTDRHILYGKLRPYLAKIARPSFAGICSTDILPILPGAAVDRGYLCHFLRQPEMVSLANSRTSGANLPRLSPNDLAKFKIPLPSISEQKRVAAILNKAEEVAKKLRQAGRLNEVLMRSTFLETFGDPATNAMRWPLRPMNAVITETQYGTSTKSNSDRIGMPVLRMNNITDTGGIDLTDVKWCKIEEADVPKFTVQKGDLLFNRTNSPELVGKTAVWDRDESYAYAGYLFRVRFKEDIVLPVYVSALLNSDFGKRLLFARAKPSINMSNLSAGEFRRIEIPVPDIAIQQSFAAAIAEMSKISKKRITAVGDAAALFRSLVRLAFRGRL